MQKYYVNTELLNVRSTPDSKSPANIISRLQRYRLADVLDKTRPDWWQIRYTEGKSTITGYVAARFLTLLSAELQMETSVGAVHLPRDPRARPDSKGAMANPLGDPGVPYVNSDSPATRIASVHQLINYLNVTVSYRYQRTTANTFCNIYACDVCYFSHAYLPRVWWYSRSIRKLQSGQPVEVSYGETVHELNANALHDWLNEWGDDFRWSRVTTHADDFQNLVNGNGSIGLICARNRDRARSGHITVVLPETDQLKFVFKIRNLYNRSH